MSFKRTFGVASSIAIAAALAAPAYAQDESGQEADSSNRNTEIIVTAQFREQRLQDTPIAITAVNAEMLEARGQTDISQVAAQAPNVTLTPQPQNGGSGLIAYIRGVGQTDFNYAMDPGVGIYVDDVFIPTLSSSLLDLMDLDRIEVLRGPQGTLAGKNSIGGAIKLFSQKPRGDGTGSLQVTYGSYNRVELRGMADFRITDNLAARISGVGKGRDGHITLLDYGVSHPNENVPAGNARGAYGEVGTQGGQSFVAGRLALKWDPTDTIEVNLSGDYTHERSEPVGTILRAAGLPQSAINPVFNPAIPYPGRGAGPGQPAWLLGKDGSAIPFDCRFVPAGPYSCDTLSTGAYKGDRRYISYANFLDGTAPTSQSPFKPYAALQNQDFNGWGLMGNVTVDLTDTLQLYYIGSWREYTTKWGQDQDASPVPIAQLDNRMDHRAWSQELRLNGEFGDGLLDYTLGGFYMDQDGSYTARVDLNYAGIDFVHGPDTTPSTSKALFLNATLHPVPNWTISGGLRRSWDEKTYTYFRRNPDGTVPFQGSLAPPPGAPPICESLYGANPVFPGGGGPPTSIGNSPNCLLTGIFGLDGEFKGKRWDWRVVTDYRFSDEFLAYASIATGYKGGGVNPRPFFGPSTGECGPFQYNPDGSVIPTPPCNQVKSFNPETLTTYEVGFKSDLLDRRLRLNGAAFYNKYNDIIFTLSACPSSPCLRPTNVGKANVKGAELELSAFPTDGLMIDGSVSYISIKYDAASVAPAGLSGDETFPYTPDWTYSFGIQYDHDVGPGTASLRFDGSYRSKIFTETFNTQWSEIPGRFLGNARLSYTTDDEDWRFSLEVQNLFDKYYFLSVSDITSSLGAVTAAPALPRTWALTVRRNF